MTSQPPRAAIRIGLIDDHAIIHDGIASWCAQAQPPILITESHQSPADFDATHSAVDVVVLDLRFEATAPDLTGVRRLCESGHRVVVFSQHTDSRIVLQCLDLGAVTYLSKAEGREHLIAAIFAATTDAPYLSPTMAKAMNSDDTVTRPSLSRREHEVLVSWFQTESRALVGERLFISSETVKTHLDRIRTKYAAAGRPAKTKAALVARAIQDGLITPNDL